MLDKTNIIPNIGIKNEFNEKMLIAPTNPPSDKEPVSPINTLALLILKNKKPMIEPIKHADRSDKP